ncbi:MAG: glycosyltransferase [Thermoplasmata archaeon]|nr:MAG: glycosyltransferase [Thermoplasmata archaeon]
MRVLYGVCSWGLGHATRSLPIIRKLIDEDNDVTIVSTGRSLDLLKLELNDTASFIDVEDYPLPYTEKSKVFLLKFFLFSPRLVHSIINEHKKMMKFIDKSKYDIIISDTRYGTFHRRIPSFFITHQLRVIAPSRIKFIENNFERFNAQFQKYFKKFMVPDYEENGISGDLAHNLNRIDSDKIVYFGIMSDFKRMEVNEDVNYLFSISGPEPQRTVMENLIFQCVNDIDGKIVLSLGRNISGDIEKMKNKLNENIHLYDFLPRKERELIMNRSKFIISRSGYSTLMDIYALGKKAMFIPTPQQTEQEYLAELHEERGNFHYVDQDKMNLPADLIKARNYKGPEKEYDTKKATERFLETIYSYSS